MPPSSHSKLWLWLTFVALGCDSAPARAPEAPTSPTAASPSSATLPVATSASAPAPAASGAPPSSAATTPPRYPESAIETAQRENRGKSCQELIYKRGCAETRTGRVLLKVTLDDAGKVAKAEVLKNGISRDPDVVAKCLLEKVPQWKFEAPGAAEPSFEMELSFGDKC
ncbi:MAG: hypothetical protein U0263_09040 [Polyangiaceae bacterium]